MQVIDPVAHVVSAADAFKRRRKPERRDSEFGQVRGRGGNLFPKGAVRRRLPVVEGMHHRAVACAHEVSHFDGLNKPGKRMNAPELTRSEFHKV